MPGWLTGTIVAATAGALLYWEWRRPLRRNVESKLRRDVRNLAVAGIAAAVVQLAELPIILPLTEHTAEQGWGLLGSARLPGWAETAIAVLLLDYSLYGWHILTHKVPLLWRFHIVHHADLDLDSTTALRFHFGEILLSVPFRAAQVIAIGVSPLAFTIWQTLLVVSILFHHSNLNLSPELDRRLSLLLVTPRMHGIHHSRVRREMDSNWSSGLAIWDRLHRTLRLDVPQDQIVIGVPEYGKPEEVSLARLLAMPLHRPEPAKRALV
jgi:sterol desaturase/sphingolipid hydroxylase (fatty acid hydroxylase superfamily)